MKRIELKDFTDGVDHWELGRSHTELSANLAAIEERSDKAVRTNKGEPFTPHQLEGMLSHIDPDEPYDEWLVTAAALYAAPCTDPDFDKCDLFTRHSRGELWSGGVSSRYSGDEVCVQTYNSVPPRVGGVGPGTLVKKAGDGGYFRRDTVEVFASTVAALEKTHSAALANSASWLFSLRDPVSDAALPPITYRDELKLWPDSPEGTVTQVTGEPKGHKTNWIMSELFRLSQTASARVLILALEGGYGVRTMRLKAQAAHYGVALADLRGRFQVVNVEKGGTFDLSDPVCVGAFVDFVQCSGWTDILIDTQHRAAGTLEENSATDARQLWNAVEFIRQEARCSVVLAHHLGKDKSKGGRGSSADLASVDQQIELAFDRSSLTVVAKVTARKDGVDGFSVPFRVHQATPGSVPILLPITSEEHTELTAGDSRLSHQTIGAALRELKAIGKANAVSTHVLAGRILLAQGKLPGDAEQAERATKSLQNRILEAARTNDRVSNLSSREGSHKTAGRVWHLLDGDFEEVSDEF